MEESLLYGHLLFFISNFFTVQEWVRYYTSTAHEGYVVGTDRSTFATARVYTAHKGPGLLAMLCTTLYIIRAAFYDICDALYFLHKGLHGCCCTRCTVKA